MGRGETIELTRDEIAAMHRAGGVRGCATTSMLISSLLM